MSKNAKRRPGRPHGVTPVTDLDAQLMRSLAILGDVAGGLSARQYARLVLTLHVRERLPESNPTTRGE